MKGVSRTFLLAFVPWEGKGEDWGSEEDKVLQHKWNGYFSVISIFNGKATIHGKVMWKTNIHGLLYPRHVFTFLLFNMANGLNYSVHSEGS